MQQPLQRNISWAESQRRLCAASGWYGTCLSETILRDRLVPISVKMIVKSSVVVPNVGYHLNSETVVEEMSHDFLILRYRRTRLLAEIAFDMETGAHDRQGSEMPCLLSMPAEASGGILLNEQYDASAYLNPLSTCRQLYYDGQHLAMTRTPFVCASLFGNIPERLSILDPKQVAAIRSISFVADQRQFRKLQDWGLHAFGVPNLDLLSLTVILHRSSPWHYLMDFTTDLVNLLRNLHGVRRFVFVRNAARVKGSFRTWYNRLVGLILKRDHHERYLVDPPNLEKIWWTWRYDDLAQTFTLEARPARERMDEETYMQQILPLMEELKESIENEEWNPDPRSRTMYY
nr:hypothetical protein CFP56_31538 [Quercus suber]